MVLAVVRWSLLRSSFGAYVLLRRAALEGGRGAGGGIGWKRCDGASSLVTVAIVVLIIASPCGTLFAHTSQSARPFSSQTLALPPFQSPSACRTHTDQFFTSCRIMRPFLETPLCCFGTAFSSSSLPVGESTSGLCRKRQQMRTWLRDCNCLEIMVKRQSM